MLITIFLQPPPHMAHGLVTTIGSIAHVTISCAGATHADVITGCFGMPLI
jgi:hypothetical protein